MHQGRLVSLERRTRYICLLEAYQQTLKDDVLLERPSEADVCSAVQTFLKTPTLHFRF